MGYIRMIRSGGMNCVSGAIRYSGGGGGGGDTYSMRERVRKCSCDIHLVYHTPVSHQQT